MFKMFLLSLKILGGYAIMAFKCMTGCAQDTFSNYVQRATIAKRTTRNSQMLNIPLFKIATGPRTFY